MLLLHHHQLSHSFMRKVECSFQCVSNDLFRAIGSFSSLSPHVPNILNLMKLLSSEVHAVKCQYCFAYLTTYNVSATQISSGHVASARINPNFIRENFRVILLCTRSVVEETFRLRSLLSLTGQSGEATFLPLEAVVLGHIQKFRRSVNIFRETLETFCHLLASSSPASQMAATYRQRTSVSDSDTGTTPLLKTGADQCRRLASDKIQKAFTADVDHLIDLVMLQEQRPTTTASASPCESVAVSTSPVVDGLSDISKSDPAPWTLNRTTETGDLKAEWMNMATEDSLSQEVLHFERLHQQTYLSENDGHAALHLRSYRELGMSPVNGMINSEVKVACADDLMSLGGFSLFVPFTTAADRPREESETKSTGLSSDGGDSGIVVKLEPADSVDDQASPADDVFHESHHRSEDLDRRLPLFGCQEADDAAENCNDTTTSICCIKNVFSVLPDGLEAGGCSLRSSTVELPSTIVEDHTGEALSAAGEQPSSDHNVTVSTSACPTMLSMPKIVDEPVQVRRHSQRQQSRNLMTSKINETAHKRKNSSEDRLEMMTRKKARKTGDQKSTSDKTAPLPTKLSSQSNWVVQKKLIIPPQPATVKRRRGRPPKQRNDNVVMPSPAELKCRPAARRKILALYRSAQFTPLDGSKRTITSGKSGGKPERQRQANNSSRTSLSGTKKAQLNKRNLENSKSRAARTGALNSQKAKNHLEAEQSSTQPSLSRRNDASSSSLAADVNNSVQQSAIKSTVDVESNTIAQSCTICDARPSVSDDQSVRINSTVVTVSSVNNNEFLLPTVKNLSSGEIGEDSSTLSGGDVNLATETGAISTTITTIVSEHGRALMDFDDDDDDDDPDRLVIDLDRTDPHSSSSDRSVSSRIQTAATKNDRGWSADEAKATSSTSPAVGCHPDTDESVEASLSVTNKPEYHLETNSGDHATTQTTSASLPVDTSAEAGYSFLSVLLYSDISDDDDEGTFAVSTTAGVPDRRTLTEDHPQSTARSSGRCVLRVRKPLSATTQMTSQTGHVDWKRQDVSHVNILVY